jgi:hypothetical protein
MEERPLNLGGLFYFAIPVGRERSFSCRRMTQAACCLGHGSEVAKLAELSIHLGIFWAANRAAGRNKWNKLFNEPRRQTW